MITGPAGYDKTENWAIHHFAVMGHFTFYTFPFHRPRNPWELRKPKANSKTVGLRSAKTLIIDVTLFGILSLGGRLIIDICLRKFDESLNCLSNKAHSFLQHCKDKICQFSWKICFLGKCKTKKNNVQRRTSWYDITHRRMDLYLNENSKQIFHWRYANRFILFKNIVCEWMLLRVSNFC